MALIAVGLGLAILGDVLATPKPDASIDRASYLCDVLVHEARRALHRARLEGRWNEILLANERLPFNEPPAVQALWNARTSPRSGELFGVFLDYANGSGFITVRDNLDEPAEGASQNPRVDTDGVLLVSVTVIMKDGAVRSVEARLRFHSPEFAPRGAVMSSGNVTLAEGFSIVAQPGATGADVVSNRSVLFRARRAPIDGKVLAGVSVLGEPSGIRDGLRVGMPRAALPIGDPSHYRSLASAILRSDGSVVDSAGTLLSPAGRDYYNFSHADRTWYVRRSTPALPPAVYFIEGDVNMAGRGVLSATLLVTGNVAIDGEGTGWDLGAARGNVAVVCGGDLSLSGMSIVRGVVVAYSVRMSGSAAVDSGSVVALGPDGCVLSGSSIVAYPGPQPTLLQLPSDGMEIVNLRLLK